MNKKYNNLFEVIVLRKFLICFQDVYLYNYQLPQLHYKTSRILTAKNDPKYQGNLILQQFHVYEFLMNDSKELFVKINPHCAQFINLDKFLTTKRNSDLWCIPLITC